MTAHKIIQRKVSTEDLRMIQYFWQEKGDLRRYCGWEEIQEDLQAQFPAIYDAWQRYRTAVETLNIVVGALDPDEIDQD